MGIGRIGGVTGAVRQVVATCLLVIVAVELESEGAEVSGAAKRAAAAERLAEAVDPWLPEWLDPALRATAGWLVDALVHWSNQAGLFRKVLAQDTEGDAG